MESLPVDGLTLYFDAEDLDAAELIRGACQQTISLLHDAWGLTTPADCRVYVLTSPLHFIFHSAPWPRRVLHALFLPLWLARVRRIWAIAGGWNLPQGRRMAVGVKPPRLIELADRSIGERFFVKVEDVEEKVRQVTCHELTHAFTAHLRLPVWLHEGVAMAAVDRAVGKPTVLHQTVNLLADDRPPGPPGSYGAVKDRDALLHLYIQSYWVTRYLDETKPDMLRQLLSGPRPRGELEREVAAAFGRDLAAFWHEIGGVVATHYTQTG
jgi:hypothetical protein